LVLELAAKAEAAGGRRLTVQDEQVELPGLHGLDHGGRGGALVPVGPLHVTRGPTTDREANGLTGGAVVAVEQHRQLVYGGCRDRPGRRRRWQRGARSGHGPDATGSPAFAR